MLVLLSIQAARGHRKTSRLHTGGTRTRSPVGLQSGLSPSKHQWPRHEDDVGAGCILHTTPAAASRKDYCSSVGPSLASQVFRARLKIPVVLDVTRSRSRPSNNPSSS